MEWEQRDKKVCSVDFFFLSIIIISKLLFQNSIYNTCLLLVVQMPMC